MVSEIFSSSSRRWRWRSGLTAVARSEPSRETDLRLRCKSGSSSTKKYTAAPTPGRNPDQQQPEQRPAGQQDVDRAGDADQGQCGIEPMHIRFPEPSTKAGWSFTRAVRHPSRRRSLSDDGRIARAANTETPSSRLRAHPLARPPILVQFAAAGEVRRAIRRRRVTCSSDRQPRRRSIDPWRRPVRRCGCRPRRKSGKGGS